MKTNISLKFKTAKMIIVIAALAPFIGFAAQAKAEDISVQASILCAKADSSTTIDRLISEKEASYGAGKAASAKALQASRAASDKALYNARVAANADYAEQFKTLAAEAQTPEQKAAVAAFKKTTLKAVETRRANVDLAVKRYREGVDSILATRSSSYLSALNTLKANIDQSLNCGTAESAFQSKISTLGDSSVTLTTLAGTRDEKVAAAELKFSTTITTAATALKTALGQ